MLIDKILDLLVAESLQPWIELIIIYVLLRDLKSFISDNWDTDYRQKLKDDLKKLKDMISINKENPEKVVE